MPTPAVSLRFRKFRRRFGIAAPRLVVRSHVPWPWLALPGLLLLMLIVAVIWLVMQRNEAGEMGHEVQTLRQQLQAHDEELGMLRATAGTRQNAVSIERATQQQLLARIQYLERENGALKEDILLFERLIPVVGEDAAVRIENFRVIHDGGGRYRYRILLAFRPDRQTPEFRGRLQLAVSFTLGGKEQQVLFPDKRGVMGEYQLEMRHFLRREGVFELPFNSQVKAVEVQVLQGDTLKSKRLAQL